MWEGMVSMELHTVIKRGVQVKYFWTKKQVYYWLLFRIHTQLGGLNSAYPTKEDLIKAYGPLLVEKIISKHTLAKKHFAKMASMTKFFEDLDKRNSNENLALNGKSIKSRSWYSTILQYWHSIHKSGEYSK